MIKIWIRLSRSGDIMETDFKNVVMKKTRLKSYLPTYIRLRLLRLKSYISLNNARLFMKFSQNIFQIFYFPRMQWKNRFVEIPNWPKPLKI